jgi:hypothetical protein
MKRKRFQEKLTLNKTTVSNLNNHQLEYLAGGATPACTDPTCSIEVCPVETKPNFTCPNYTCKTVEDTSCYKTICA